VQGLENMSRVILPILLGMESRDPRTWQPGVLKGPELNIAQGSRKFVFCEVIPTMIVYKTKESRKLARCQPRMLQQGSQ
jgi:hypothetical protein